MSVSPPDQQHSSLPPDHFLDKLAGATVSFDELFDLSRPGKSYVSLMKESFTGDKTIMARITGDEARLMPIGLYPLKGRSAVSSSGYLSCRVQPDGTGSVIRSSYLLAVVYRIAIPGFLLFGILMLLAIAALIGFAEGLDGRWMMVGGATFFLLLSIGFPLWILRGAKTQERLTREFLSKFVAANS